VSVTREVIWTGHDQLFVRALTAELGILLDAEIAAVSIVRSDRSARLYVIDDGSIELSPIAGANRIEVRRSIVGTRQEAVVDLNEQRASRVRLLCLALVDRIQVREIDRYLSTYR
jgi:hypothetical protein